MTWSPAKDKGGYSSKGGGVIKIKEVNDDGSDFTTPSTIYDIGYYKESSFSDNTPINDIFDEAGDSVATEEQNRIVKVTATGLDRTKLYLDLAKECRGKFYALKKDNGTVNGKNQEMFFGIGKIEPSFDVKLQGGETQFSYTALKTISAITIAAASLVTTLWDAHTSATVTIPASDFYLIVETAV